MAHLPHPDPQTPPPGAPPIPQPPRDDDTDLPEIPPTVIEPPEPGRHPPVRDPGPQAPPALN
jgi:hypothetical protein